MAFVASLPLISSRAAQATSPLWRSRPARPARPARQAVCRRGASMNLLEAFAQSAADGSGTGEGEEEEKRTSIPLDIKDGMDFFRYREGEWDSWRVTHHLAFRRSESGESRIQMQCLPAEDERVVKLAKDWEIDPATVQGGCYVTWRATLDWDQEGENHEGETVFALVPEPNDMRKGKMLRDRGYAEVVPIAGTYHLDEQNALNLETPYEGGAVIEQFKFDGPDVVNRLSTVKRFGGFSTATYACEQRVNSGVVDDTELNEEEEEELMEMLQDLQFLSLLQDKEDENAGEAVSSGETTAAAGAAQEGMYRRGSRWATAPLDAKPPSSSMFANSSFNVPGQADTDGNGAGNASETEIEQAGKETLAGVSSKDISDAVTELASRAGIDLSKIPPSMRADFLASFETDANDSENSSSDVDK